MPKIREVLKELIICNDERRNERCGDGPALPITPWETGVPPARGPLNEKAPTKYLNFAQKIAPCCGSSPS